MRVEREQATAIVAQFSLTQGVSTRASAPSPLSISKLKTFCSEMKDPWKFTDYVKPVCLPGMHQFPQPGTLCKVAGWGSVHEVAPGHFLWHVEMSRSLRAVHVPIIEQILREMGPESAFELSKALLLLLHCPIIYGDISATPSYILGYFGNLEKTYRKI